MRGVLPDYAQVAVSIAYCTGLRIGEVLGLKWSQVDLVEGKPSLTPVADQNRNIQGGLPASRSTPRLVGGKATTRGHISRFAVGLPAPRGTVAGRLSGAGSKPVSGLGLEGRALFTTSGGQRCANMTRAGFLRRWRWRSSGHKTRSVFDRYNIVNGQTSRWQRRPSPPTTSRKRLHFRLHWQNWVGRGSGFGQP